MNATQILVFKINTFSKVIQATALVNKLCKTRRRCCCPKELGLKFYCCNANEYVIVCSRVALKCRKKFFTLGSLNFKSRVDSKHTNQTVLYIH